MSEEHALRSTPEWLREPEYQYVRVIADPDGWDRSSPEAFNASWSEKIPRDEFEQRLGRSTISFRKNKEAPP
jgi:hypothetical protein